MENKLKKWAQNGEKEYTQRQINVATFVSVSVAFVLGFCITLLR